MRILVACLTILCATSALANENGSVGGKLADRNGDAIPGVTMTLSKPGTTYSRSQVTDREGNYSFDAVPTGDGYVVRAELPGFRTATRRKIVVQANASTPVSMRLRIRQEESGHTAIVVTSIETPGQFILTREMLDKLPIR